LPTPVLVPVIKMPGVMGFSVEGQPEEEF